MNGADFIEALGWGSTFLLLWLLLLGELPLNFGMGCALVFFFLVGALATMSKGMENEKKGKKPKV